MVVEHDVTEVDRYGAKRQTDVKITQRTRFHTYVTLVECKRWKEPVSRDRVDVLAASIEALGAQKGAIFATSSFEAGAAEYAKGKHIDIFVVRDLTPAEWGMPGRQVHLFMHLWAGEFRNIAPGMSEGIALVEPSPGHVSLEMIIDKDMARDPDLDLRSFETGQRGPNLVSVFVDAHNIVLRSIAQGVGLLRDGRDGERLQVLAAGELDLVRHHFASSGCLRLPSVLTESSLNFELQFPNQRSAWTEVKGSTLL